MSKIANFIYKRIILSILLLLFIYPICIYAQDEVKVYFNETQINEIIATIIDARGFNFGDYTGDFISDAYFGNIDGATIDIHNNSTATIHANLVVTAVDIIELINNVTVHADIDIDGDLVINQEQGENIFSLEFIPTDAHVININSGSWEYFDVLFQLYVEGHQLIIKNLPDLKLDIGNAILPEIITSYFTSPVPSLSTNNTEVIFGWSIAGDRRITIQNNVEAVNSLGNIELLDGGNWLSFSSPHTDWWPLNSNLSFRPASPVIENAGNHYRFIWWDDIQNYTYQRNVNVSQDLNYYAKFLISQPVTLLSSLDGMLVSNMNFKFLEQSVLTPVMDYAFMPPNSTPVEVITHQTYQSHNCYFVNWADGNISPTRNISITQPTTYTANFKGAGFSSDEHAFIHNNQRRIIKSSNGNLHMVYESMNHVWYERKTSGGDWELMNGGKPLDRNNGAAWNPSIDFLPSPEGGNDVVIITFVEEQPLNGYNIMVQVYSQGNYLYQESALAENFSISSESTPVIALGHQTFVVGWTHGLDLFYRLGQIGSQIYWDDEDVRFINIGGDAEKSHPTIGTDHNYVGQLDNYKLAWDQNGRIWVAHLEVTLSQGTYPYNIGVTEGYSFSQAGFTSNYEPSISVMPNSDYRLSWIGENYLTKSGQLPDRKVVTWFNNQFYIFGTSVTSHSTSATSDGRDIITYGDYNGGQNKFAHIWYYTYYKALNTIGAQTHLSNGSSLNDMYAMSFQNSTSPFSFSMSQNLGSLSKINNANISSGREALVTGDSTQFYFILGDVTELYPVN